MLVVVAILVLLASLLFPALRSAREAAFAVKCAGNLRQIGVAASLYTDDYDGVWPIGAYSQNGDRSRWDTSWHDLLAPRLGTGTVFFCPSAPLSTPYRWAYGCNRFISGWFLGANGAMISKPEQEVFVSEKRSGDWVVWSPLERSDPYWTPLDRRHANRVNILWADGHVSAKDPANLIMRVEWRG